MAPTPRPTRRVAWIRIIAAYVVTLGFLFALAGRSAFRPSPHQHFVQVAEAWLDGRLHHEGHPPGFCSPHDRKAGACTHHQFDDWSAVYTVHLADGKRFRGFPCRTTGCKQSRAAGVEVWWSLEVGGWTAVSSSAIERRDVTWYVCFPPGPVLLFLPFVWLLGAHATWAPLMTIVLTAAIPAVMIGFLDRIRGCRSAHLWLAAAWALGSPAAELAPLGHVWFVAQLFAALMAMVFIAMIWDMRRPGWAGVAFALMLTTRPSMVGLAVIGFDRWWTQRRTKSAAFMFLAPLALAVMLLAWHNWARFGDPLEFGYRFLEVRWQARVQEHGWFSPRYLSKNLYCLFGLRPRISFEPFDVRVSIHGLALWIASPWVWAVAWARSRGRECWTLWIAIALVAAVSLLYQNTGQVQFSYRFALDWLIPFVVLLGLGDVDRRPLAFRLLVIASIGIHAMGAYRWIHRPTELFVLDPVEWPWVEGEP